MSIQHVSFKDVAVSDTPTHIVIYREGLVPAPAPAPAPSSEVNKKIEELTMKLEQIIVRVKELEESIDGRLIKTTPFFGSSIAPEPEGLMVRRLSDVETDTKTTFQTIIHKLNYSPERERDHERERERERDHEREADAEAEVEAGVEVEDEESEEKGQLAENDEGEEEEVVEYTEFEYKGVMYYKDSENLVYKVDEDGDLDDTPIGVWNEEKQKVLRYKQ
jgi:hypothetical protein